MAWPTATDLTNLMTASGITLAAAADEAGAISWATAYIEHYTGRTWTATEAGTSRKFDGEGSEWLHIGEITSITAVQLCETDGTVYETLTANEDYVAYPLNTTIKDRLRIPDGLWPIGTANIIVKGTWAADGGTQPADLKQACLYLAGLFILGEAGAASSGGINRKRQGEVEIEYGDSAYSSTAKGWKEYVNKTIALHRRVYL